MYPLIVDRMLARQNPFAAPGFSTVLALIALLLTWFPSPPPVRAGAEVTVEGVLHVRNGSHSELGIETYRLEEMWRVGGDDETDIFGLLLQALVGQNGRLYLLDAKLCEVAVFSPTGEREGTLSRRGEGPGEMRNPVDMVFLPGDRLGLVQHFPATMSIVSLDGTPAGTFRLFGDDAGDDSFTQLFEMKSTGNELIAGYRLRKGDRGGERTSVVARFAQDGTELVVYERVNTVMDFQSPRRNEEENFAPDFGHWAVLPDGRLCVAPHRNQYRFNIYHADGSLDRVVERAYSSYRRTKEEQYLQSLIMEAQTSHLPREVDITVSTTEPDIERICTGPDGNLWVETSRGRRSEQPGVMMVWEVFTPLGHFLKQVSLIAPHDALEDLALFTGSERITVITRYYTTRREFMTHGLIGSRTEEPTDTTPMAAIMYRMVPLSNRDTSGAF